MYGKVKVEKNEWWKKGLLVFYRMIRVRKGGRKVPDFHGSQIRIPRHL